MDLGSNTARAKKTKFKSVLEAEADSDLLHELTAPTPFKTHASGSPGSSASASAPPSASKTHIDQDEAQMDLELGTIRARLRSQHSKSIVMTSFVVFQLSINTSSFLFSRYPPFFPPGRHGQRRQVRFVDSSHQN
jgi:hypothetical protein